MIRLLKEPLLHFLVVGALIFFSYSRLAGPGGGGDNVIVVTLAQQRNLANTFERNVAAGADAYGFNFDSIGLDFDIDGSGNAPLQSNLRGWEHQELSSTPGHAKYFSFKNNTAHSCGRVGFFADNGRGRLKPYFNRASRVA